MKRFFRLFSLKNWSFLLGISLAYIVVFCALYVLINAEEVLRIEIHDLFRFFLIYLLCCIVGLFSAILSIGDDANKETKKIILNLKKENKKILGRRHKNFHNPPSEDFSYYAREEVFFKDKWIYEHGYLFELVFGDTDFQYGFFYHFFYLPLVGGGVILGGAAMIMLPFLIIGTPLVILLRFLGLIG